MAGLVSKKWKLAIRVAPFVAAIILIKLIVHQSGFEFLSLNSLFGAIISANVFLVGFLISGVLVDYKESEKIPGELACSLEVFTDECYVIYKNNKADVSVNLMTYIKDLTSSIILWLHKKEKTSSINKKITGINEFYLELEKVIPANFIVRLKNEQHNLRKLISRIHTIRETSFNPAGYAIAEIISAILCFGLIFTKIDPFYESIFFVAFVTFILIYMIMLIRDLDNPFGYYEKEAFADEVSILPLFELEKRVSSELSSKF